MAGSSIEATYQKKTPLEHILLRPDTYVGSLEHQEAKLWVWGPAEGHMVSRNVSFVPGLYKIFDELLVNAADNYQRDKSMNKIEVHIDKAEGCISVWNNGKGIPVAVHGEYQVYVPELIFGHLLTSSNYDDSKRKVTGGRNGYGAKLANVFSTKFQVETADSERMLRLRMEWRNNMRDKGQPEVTKLKSKEDYTKVTFWPDLERLKMHSLDQDILDIMTKRVYDLAGCTTQKVKVWLNGTELKVRNFQDYIGLYQTGEDKEVIYRAFGDRWEVGFCLSDGIFQQVSFVNAICTIKGGTHVNCLADQLTDAINGILQKKHRKLEVKPAHIRQHMWLFVNALIENPAFDSQTKETLTLKASQFGSACTLEEDFVKEVLASGIVEHVVAFADAKTSAQLSKKVKGKKQDKVLVAKLEDANDAGSKRSQDCTLILTEGDSAKTLVLAGFEVIGRDRFGVFPLKGKLLNVREASTKQLMENDEIQNVMKIMGLQPKREYESLSELRYGSLMVMADQDLDGSHIKGLIINFVHFFWPGLLKVRGFLKEFITPIVKATSKSGQDVKAFYTLPQFETWRKSVDGGRWTIKYYKGLGTSTSKEAKEYFSDLERHKLQFIWRSDESDQDAIDLAFNKKRADDRKKWLENLDPDVYLDMQGDIQFSEFVHKELVLFSQYDNVRSIPSLVDGLKPGQRKILFSCFKRKLDNELKVAQLSGYVAEKSAYHHGEMSLAQTIVGLAQCYVGSNNLNLLQPIGQFGTRAGGGKDHASPRYIFTCLSPATRKLFCEEDDALLAYQDEEGMRIEPHWYVPVIPMVLVNGADGIGTGWSTSVPQYNPMDLIAAIKNRMRDIAFDTAPIHPWYKGFSGGITRNGNNYDVAGSFERIGLEWLKITELPLKKWTSDYKAFLTDLLKSEEPLITDLKEYHTETTVHFEVKCPTLQTLTDQEVVKRFKLAGSISMNNLVLFNKDRRICRYGKVEEIMEEHFGVRKEHYSKRKDYLLGKLTRECEMISNKVRFILMVVSNELIINMKQKKTLCKELKSRGFATKSDLAKIFSDPKAASEAVAEPPEAETDQPGEVGTKEYDYLLGMALWALTMEEVEKLKQEKQKLLAELEALKATSLYQLWDKDLDALKTAIEEVWRQQESDQKTAGARKPPKKREASAKKKPKKEKENRKVPETAPDGPKLTVFDSIRAKFPVLNKVENLSASLPSSKPPTPAVLPNRQRKAPEPIISDSIQESDSDFEL